MRLFPFHNGASAPDDGDVMEPRTNLVTIQAEVTGPGTATATVQPKGRVIPDGPWEAIGDPLTLSGSGSASGSVTLSGLGASQLIADLTACSCTSFRCWGSEADR
jgi:hypothetical protein